MSNNHKNFSCPFAEQIVSYLYNESSAAENNRFQAHLKNCLPCADELESFGFVRASISEWRETEFSRLPTPIIAIPELQIGESRSSVPNSETKRSWFADFRRLFAFNGLTATAAFGILIVCAGLFWLAFDSKTSNDTAEILNDKNLAQAVVSPTVKITENFEVTKNTELTIEKPSSKTLEVKSANESAPPRAIVKVSGNASKNNAGQSNRKQENAAHSRKKIAPVKKPSIPILDDAEDDADETIRLADLFAELDTK